MTYGYSVRVLKQNAAADDANAGVRLGRVCIEKGISVTEAAVSLGVSRQTIYNWFCGFTEPAPAAVGSIEEYIASLS